MTVITRFAPSPTGYLHIGGARTALFSWLFARRHNGKFLLRIEDTDRERSTQAATDAIIDGMKWLGLDWDGEVVHQFACIERHKEVASQLLAAGKAYQCYTSQAELAAMREQGKGYDRSWRDRDPKEAPAGVRPVIRLKSPLEGEVTLNDHVRGAVKVPAAQLEDLIILRSDGTPTYNLAVVVDDHDMGVTHIIRGEDHITNAAKQILIYQLMGWKEPEFAHVPLIHGPDGAKLSKRHGALGVDAYRDMGYLPEALRNYLLRLGWSHGNDEIISTKQAIEWFNLEGIGKSASRFDFTKLENLNGHYIREAEDERLLNLILPMLENILKGGEASPPSLTLTPSEGVVADAPPRTLATRDSRLVTARLRTAMHGLKQRAKTIIELADNAAFYILPRPIPMNDKAKALLNDGGKAILRDLLSLYEKTNDWTEENTQAIAKDYAEKNNLKLGIVAQPLRAALSGSNVSPSVFEVMTVLGNEESLARIRDVL